MIVHCEIHSQIQHLTYPLSMRYEWLILSIQDKDIQYILLLTSSCHSHVEYGILKK